MLDRPVADEQLRCDLVVLETHANQPSHLRFAPAERAMGPGAALARNAQVAEGSRSGVGLCPGTEAFEGRHRQASLARREFWIASRNCPGDPKPCPRRLPWHLGAVHVIEGNVEVRNRVPSLRFRENSAREAREPFEVVASRRCGELVEPIGGSAGAGDVSGRQARLNKQSQRSGSLDVSGAELVDTAFEQSYGNCGATLREVQRGNRLRRVRVVLETLQQT